MSEVRPLVTVLMAVYNGELFLAEAIESILNQTYTNFEFLIINDGSTDATERIILSYKDERIRYIKNEQNLKLIASLNKGLDLANGKYIARMDADDISLPERLDKQVNFMEQFPEFGVLGSWVKTIGLQTNREIRFKTGHDQIRFELFFHNYLHHPTVMIRNEVIKNNNIQYETYLHAEDYALWIALSKYTKIEILPEILLYYRLHNENISTVQRVAQQNQTSILRKQQIQDLEIQLMEHELKLYEDFVDREPFFKSEDFTAIILIIQRIVLKNNEKKMIQKDILFDYFNQKFRNYVEVNAFKMSAEINDYLNSVFAPSKVNQAKILLKNKLGLKKLWN